MRLALGIDLSEWDLRPLDWQKASELLSFAFIKISQGTNPDPLFRAQWEASEGYILRGLYHMLDPRIDVDSSVDRTIELYKTVSPGELPPALDLELGEAKTELPRSRRWLERWENKTGKRPIIYTSLGFLNLEQNKAENQWLSKYPLWLASWPYDGMSEDPRRERIRAVLRGDIFIPFPAPPRPWARPVEFHQWTSRGEPEDIPGYYMGRFHKEAVDLNYFGGTREDLFLRYGEPRKLPGNGETMTYKYSITPTRSDGSKVRSDHYVIDSPVPNRIGSLSFGRFAFGDEKWISPAGARDEDAAEVWLRIKSLDGVPFDGWIAAKHKGARYGTIAPIGPGEETPEPSSGSVDFSVNVEAEETAAGLEISFTVSSFGYLSQTTKLTLPRET